MFKKIKDYGLVIGAFLVFVIATINGIGNGENKYDAMINGEPDYFDGECDIKGNVGRTGEKIYHLPGDEWYEKTLIEKDKGEQWFCTALEAEKAGWRRAWEYTEE